MFLEIFINNFNIETVVLYAITSALAALIMQTEDYSFGMAFTTSIVLGIMFRIAVTNIIPSVWNTVYVDYPSTFIAGVIFNTTINYMAALMGRIVFTRKIAV